MIQYFISLPHYLQALIAGCFTWLITTLGSAIIYFFKKVNKTVMDGMISLAAGVMIAASFWSLLNPAIDIADNLGIKTWFICAFGFLCGGLIIFFINKLFNKKLENYSSRKFMLIFSITLHNIPEGLAIGVAFGGIISGINNYNIISALLLAIGIGIQNFPEGSAISMPLYRDGCSKFKAFLIGSLSAIVEPISALIGALLVTKIVYLLPYMLSLAAGAMIYVVAIELIPEGMKNEKKDLMALFTLFGFTIMMVLDVALS